MLTAVEILHSLVPDVLADPQKPASEFISTHWEAYKNGFPSNNSLNGNIFEELIAISLIRNNIFPFSMQAQIAFIPGVDYDFVIYTEKVGPVVLSAKTSLRERWKQADLEALALKNIHRLSRSYVVSLSEKEIETRKHDKASTMAISNFVLATRAEFDDLLTEIKSLNPIPSPTVEIVTSNKIMTLETYAKRYKKL